MTKKDPAVMLLDLESTRRGRKEVLCVVVGGVNRAGGNLSTFQKILPSLFLKQSTLIFLAGFFNTLAKIYNLFS
jgi:hypothetical protein